MMDKRKQIILLAIAKDYISTAEPVGSRTIVKHYKLGISPATVRNEMADLEDSGYLTQPHTSAGRIPSDMGYRFYVDVLMSSYELTSKEKALIETRLAQKKRDIESLVSDSAKIVSELCANASVILGPVMQRSRFKQINFVKLSAKRIMVILVASPGMVDDQVIELDSELSTEDLEIISNYLNEKLGGMYLSDIDDKLLNNLASEVSRYTSMKTGASELLKISLQTDTNGKVYLDGTSHMLVQPEFRDIDKAKILFESLESEDVLRHILYSTVGIGNVMTKIGTENDIESLKECSIVGVTYGFGGRVTGSLGVIGPTRMNYSRVVSIVNHVAKTLGNKLEKLQSDGE